MQRGDRLVEYTPPSVSTNPAKRIAREIKKLVKLRGGVFDRVHGNQFQSGWPGYFMFLPDRSPGNQILWVQVTVPGGTLTRTKRARFQLWNDFGVPIVIASKIPGSIEELDQLYKQYNNWLVLPVSSRGRSILELYQEFESAGEQELTRGGPEALIASRLRVHMKRRGWLVQKTHGNKYQSGWPDFFLYHPELGYRWVETKSDNGKLEPTQVGRFRRWARSGIGVWVLKSEFEGCFLHLPPNWYEGPRKKWSGLKGLL